MSLGFSIQQSKVSELYLVVYPPVCQQLWTFEYLGTWTWTQSFLPHPKKFDVRSAVTGLRVLLQGQVNLRGSTEAIPLLGEPTAAGK